MAKKSKRRNPVMSDVHTAGMSQPMSTSSQKPAFLDAKSIQEALINLNKLLEDRKFYEMRFISEFTPIYNDNNAQIKKTNT